MAEGIRLHYDVSGTNFVAAGSATEDVRNHLKMLGIASDDIRRIAIAMYEGEINMVIHAGGGEADVVIFVDRMQVKLTDHGKGIADIAKAVEPGYSTASDEIRQLGFGAGMGLPNMKKYTDEFDIQSEVGKGTTVTMAICFK